MSERCQVNSRVLFEAVVCGGVVLDYIMLSVFSLFFSIEQKHLSIVLQYTVRCYFFSTGQNNRSTTHTITNRDLKTDYRVGSTAL